MARRLTLPVIAPLTLTVLFSSIGRPADGDVPKSGTIITVAGTGEAGFDGDGAPATQAKLFLPHRAKLDAAGNLYIPDLFNHRIRKVGPDGKISTIAGSAGAGIGAGCYYGDGLKATEARLDKPQGVVFDGDGNMFIMDSQNNRVRKVDPQGFISTVVGSGPIGDGKGGYSGDNIPAIFAWLNRAADIAMDAANNLYIADTDNRRVRKVSTDRIITTFAGNGLKATAGDGGKATDASITEPHGLAFDAAGNLYIADFPGHVVRKVDTNGIITTVAGTGTAGFAGDGGPATAAQLNMPHGVAVDTEGNLFIADTFNHRVRKVDPKGVITTVVGNGKPVFTEEGGQAADAGLRGPLDVTVDAVGNLYIAETGFFANRTDKLGFGERILKVFGVAAPGLLNGRPFPKQ